MTAIMHRSAALAAAIVLCCLVPISAQPPLFESSLPKDEFAARRAKVFDTIGDAVVVMQGAAETASYEKFRQSNQFYYLTGIEVPRAMLVMDGRTKSTSLYLMPTTPQMERAEGPLLAPGQEAETLTGIAHVLPYAEFDKVVPALAGRTVYTTVRDETRGAGTPDRAIAHARAREADPWDGMPSREAWLRTKLSQKAPGIQFANLDDVLDEMRMVKSPREIALERESSRIAGLGLMEVMRSAEPGMYEYELEAIGDYIFKEHNSQGPAYFALTAAGKNAFWPHYHAAQAQLKSGDLVLMDYAPDYHYYQSDVTRMFPANGHFTPEQRELYGVYVKLYQAIMTSIRPGPALPIFTDAVAKMDRVMATYTFTKQKYRDAAARFVDSYRARVANPRAGATLGHMVGMEAHDAQKNFKAYVPGMVFTIEPALTIPEDHVYIRLEDMLLITPTGYENMSGFVPVDPDAIERLMAEPGIAQYARKR